MTHYIKTKRQRPENKTPTEPDLRNESRKSQSERGLTSDKRYLVDKHFHKNLSPFKLLAFSGLICNKVAKVLKRRELHH